MFRKVIRNGPGHPARADERKYDCARVCVRRKPTRPPAAVLLQIIPRRVVLVYAHSLNTCIYVCARCESRRTRYTGDDKI